MSEIEHRVKEWETQVLPVRARGRALYRLMPGAAEVSLVALAIAAAVSGQRWLQLVALAGAGYNLFRLYAEDRWGVTCEIADHWVGDGEMPEAMTEVCPSCRHIPFRTLWRGGRR